ncbi:glycosyltransferase [Candidatus Pelagibacter sp.]|uniref:glycosyltransferase n=1 Tax=Candidatus Pelagibacter sp. TaxID=2024849 RepID=UPI003F82A81C
MYISYWAPFFDKIATVKSVQNSIKSILLFHKGTKKIDLLNFFDEWSDNKIDNNNTKDGKLNYINFYKRKLINLLPKNSFIKSRLSFCILFILGIYPLINYLKKKQPDYFVIHLISSLPLFILILFNFKTKFILRVSGLPKLTVLRKLIWKLSNKKIYKVFVPTEATLQTLIAQRIFDSKKLFLLRDPVFEIKNIKRKNKIDDIKYKNFFLAIGRLTKQKNHQLLLKAFKEIFKKNKNYSLVILGDGELKNNLVSLTKKNGLENNVNFLGNVNNVYEYIRKSICVISTSLWEDPGFVMIETAASRKIIISSDCPNGPKEFIGNNEAGYIFQNNNSFDLVKQINHFLKEPIENINLKKLEAIKRCRKYSLFNHYSSLVKHIN